MSKPKNAQSSGNGEPKALSKVERHDMSDDSVDDVEEPERDEEKTPAQVAKLSEAVAKSVMDVVSKKVSTPNSDGNVEPKEPATVVRVDDQDLLDDIAGELTPQQIIEKHHMRMDALKKRLPRLQLQLQRERERNKTFMEGGKGTNQTTSSSSSSSVPQTVPQAPQAPQAPNPVTPVTPQNPPSTYTVPAVPATPVGVTLPTIQPVPSSPVPQTVPQAPQAPQQPLQLVQLPQIVPQAPQAPQQPPQLPQIVPQAPQAPQILPNPQTSLAVVGAGEGRPAISYSQYDIATAETDKLRKEKELEDLKKAKAKEEKLEAQPPVATPMVPPTALLDFTKLPPEAQKDFLDKGGLDTLLKLSLLQNPKSMENPIALILLTGTMAR